MAMPVARLASVGLMMIIVTVFAVDATGQAPPTVITESVEMTGVDPSNPYDLPPPATVRIEPLAMSGIDPANPYDLPAPATIQTEAIEMSGFQ